MRTMRYFFAALALTSALSLSTFAGDIHTGLEPEPTPTPDTLQGQIEIGLHGEMGTPGGEEATTADAVVVTAVDLVQTVLSLLE